MNKIDSLDTCESTYFECTSTDEAKNYKEDTVVEKEELIMKKDM